MDIQNAIWTDADEISWNGLIDGKQMLVQSVLDRRNVDRLKQGITPDPWPPILITKDDLYRAANAEYVERGVILTGAKARGSSPKQALNATAIKEIHRGGPNASSLANLHDKLEVLKDAIEAAPTQAELDLIDVTDAAHWT